MRPDGCETKHSLPGRFNRVAYGVSLKKSGGEPGESRLSTVVPLLIAHDRPAATLTLVKTFFFKTWGWPGFSPNQFSISCWKLLCHHQPRPFNQGLSVPRPAGCF
ncbi:hypothetical protein RRG08_047269 [Elysia crispata]|uniref:Uncharacterized protein n=1 Tax=Elysia crispata TaxID=231223 RepID=A0AAE0ZD71_9GAST|nr:hypothetical protein RRG08_047269 [Elysia crispata]